MHAISLLQIHFKNILLFKWWLLLLFHHYHYQGKKIKKMQILKEQRQQILVTRGQIGKSVQETRQTTQQWEDQWEVNAGKWIKPPQQQQFIKTKASTYHKSPEMLLIKPLKERHADVLWKIHSSVDQVSVRARTHTHTNVKSLRQARTGEVLELKTISVNKGTFSDTLKNIRKNMVVRDVLDKWPGMY